MLFFSTSDAIRLGGAYVAHPDLFGRLIVPRSSTTLLDLFGAWGMDNGAFSGFDQSAFFAMLRRCLPYQVNCKFVVAPDVPFDWTGTLRRFVEDDWGRSIRALGYPVAIAVQDGATVDNIPWPAIDAVFIGGSTLWKREHYTDLPLFPDHLTPRDEIIREARRRGLWVHIGRQANSRKQLRQAFHMGADSVDGTGETRAPDQQLQWIAQTMWELNGARARL